MAKIEPFAGVHYNLEVVEDISKVVCPPYDIIDAGGQEQFYQRHAYNIIRLILGKDFSADNDRENKYTRAGGYLEEWLRRGVLTQDNERGIYFYEQVFTHEGEKKTRLGVIALMRLDDEGQGRSVYPHEHTHTAPKEDRLKLLKSVEANLSPIFTVFSDPKAALEGIFKKQVFPQKPLFDIVDDEDIGHRLWRVTDETLIGQFKEFLGDKQLFIADGHHRHEVARMFRELKRKESPAGLKDSYNYIMTYLTPLEDEGLCILPTHRLIRNAVFAVEDLSSCFDVKEVPGAKELSAAMKERQEDVGVFGLYKDHHFYLLKLSEKRACNKMIQEGPKDYKNLDVVILHKVVFDHLCKIALEDIAYEIDLGRAVAEVDSGAYSAVFVLNPTKMEQIRSIALGGHVMPQKSTYFYPKLLSGLVINKL
ncbi:hypothetical protein BU251_02950 [Candidatus Velamenicoccus archaeovorus]|uniref:DUF1015 domain-containing protein n=1 Tax=Velamenicoccus archaeovorus TaxID=1930593 RepID=A0A410P3I7_VELA1|nr:DUF1015 domain-containing protein [Candidatus Velamenicoccus archaeovorus]QAT16765.1 hypothetical protein BU251_02950 [Candidatus Velamenicoccus archaeovorus]